MDHAGGIGRCNYAKVSRSITMHLSYHCEHIAMLCAGKYLYLCQFDRFSMRNSATAAAILKFLVGSLRAWNIRQPNKI